MYWPKNFLDNERARQTDRQNVVIKQRLICVTNNVMPSMRKHIKYK